MKTAIIDYDAGNLANVVRAATRAGLDVVVTRNPAEIRDASALVLPGVGAMKDAMDHLNGYGLTGIIREEVKKGKKLAGICLGMQALYDVSEENGHIPALGLLPGRIVRFPEGKLKVPHMGWNELVIQRPHEVLEGLAPHSYVYFVHSYYKTPGHTEDVIASADYGVTVPAVVGKDNVLGFQFHPEKSGPVGMAIWERLAKWLMK
ncbi:imidazole glycerol phosphate synthase subunit HisH [uncultured Dialister sp.]|jgi:glutamine amidotransferase|uniref:imidazole glycerol phosphate synthase subunit HisH n=1 Tax=uncultured Dialister sp. TaxID=278064 RepID=UPI0025CCEF41|nr:imidazole glycerol phosphate synthase subunit HisH [uncultured Dialister sp.]